MKRTPLPPVHCSPLFAFVQNPQQSQGFTPERCTHSFAGVLLNQRIVRGFFPVGLPIRLCLMESKSW
jgi:hypothetical protein